MWGALFDERERACHLQLLLVLASKVIIASESRGTQDQVLLSDSKLPQPGAGGRSLYPQTLGSFFVASYDSQDYGGGIHQSQSYFTIGGWNHAPWWSGPEIYFATELLRP
jgi:hypothetical protein